VGANYTLADPNSLVCPVCLGMPGSLPVINRQAVECVIMTGLAFQCEIAEFSKFDRKNYNYPDLVKGYQISQYDLPLCRNGWTEIRVGDKTKRIGIQRVHLEEDTGKLIHIRGQSLIDYNRSGVPLMEIVTAPDFGSVEEVQEYARKLRSMLRYLGVNSGNMEEGALRIEANVSIRPVGSVTKGTLVELKNLNSFRRLALCGIPIQTPRGIGGTAQAWPRTPRLGRPRKRCFRNEQRSAEALSLFSPSPTCPLWRSLALGGGIRQRCPKCLMSPATSLAQHGLSDYGMACDRKSARWQTTLSGQWPQEKPSTSRQRRLPTGSLASCSTCSM